MKVSTIILPVALILLLLVTGLFASTISLKKKYLKVDKSDLYRTHEKTDVFDKYGF